MITVENLLRGSLIAGALYFTAIAAAHFAGWKVPGLFIYFDVPSRPYQDTIIAFLAFGWALFFLAAARLPAVVPSLLLACGVALAGLVRINLSAELAALAGDAAPYWIQTSLLAGYVAWLALFQLLIVRRRGRDATAGG